MENLGFQQILEVCEELIAEKTSLLEQLPHDQPHGQPIADFSLEEARHISLLSSVTSSGNYIIACDPGTKLEYHLRCSSKST